MSSQGQPLPRRTPVSFDELLGWLAQDGLLEAAQAQDLFDLQEQQRAKLVQQKRSLQGLPPSATQELLAGLTPIELFLSFGLKDAGGVPFREDRITEIYALRIGLPYEKLDPLKLNAEFTTSMFSKPFARASTTCWPSKTWASTSRSPPTIPSTCWRSSRSSGSPARSSSSSSRARATSSA